MAPVRARYSTRFPPPGMHPVQDVGFQRQTCCRARGQVAYVPQHEKVNLRFPATTWDAVMMGDAPIGVVQTTWSQRSIICADPPRTGRMWERA